MGPVTATSACSRCRASVSASACGSQEILCFEAGGVWWILPGPNILSVFRRSQTRGHCWCDIALVLLLPWLSCFANDVQPPQRVWYEKGTLPATLAERKARLPIFIAFQPSQLKDFVQRMAMRSAPCCIGHASCNPTDGHVNEHTGQCSSTRSCNKRRQTSRPLEMAKLLGTAAG